MKTFIFSFGILFLALVSATSAQTNSSFHPFIRWEIEQIARIDSLWVLDDSLMRESDYKTRDPRDSIATYDLSTPYFRREEGRYLLDSIPNLKIEKRADVLLELTALDTLMYSNLSNAAHAYWEYDVMDRLLNIVYKLVMNSSGVDGKVALKADEIQWLKKRNRYLKEVEDERKRNGEGTAFEQIAAEQGSDFVRKRVLYLTGKLTGKLKD
jgi:uncharacterized protein YecT (DUF1311 family)